ncbi:hypothetical protein PILCRDRAFT_812840 [Piloderma croceum F 1598]|uniref:Uncharacterized protein n=1 Tax=Piloderma croceum (strain F 1598) TaxID=765440 RepID=A0A0C3G1A1_PILCF|nr:hypothetical protein PILCRDRAFT_812840 [Piloderma croceum F 1598]
MEDEEAEWQKGQTQIGGQPEDEDQDGYEAMVQDQDQGKRKATDKCGDDVMNEGEGEATDEDDDILPGCYDLDISIDGMAPSSLWIRADYIRIYNFFQAHYDKHAHPMARAPSAVLTGQPGIGKSFWIYYAARRRMAETKPFIWFYKANYYLFVDEGVYKLPPDWRHDDFLCIMWTLVDSDQNRPDVPVYLIPHGTCLFVMYVTSPVAKRWSRMNKTTRRIVLIMNPWGRREIQRAARLSPLETITETHVNETFDELGPVPRLCIDQTSDEQAEYRSALHQAISKITTDEIQKLTQNTSGLTMNAISQKICLLSRQQRDDVHSQAVVAPITDSIKSRLSNQFRNLPRAEQIRLYKFFEKMPELRKTAGIFYQAIVQSRLQKSVFLELVPMVKLEKRKRSKTLPQGHLSNILMHNPSLEASRQQALGQRLAVKIQPKKTLEYTDDGLQSIEPDMTIALSHDINQGLIAVANNYSFPPMEKWRFAFIIPPNLTLSVPRPWKLALRSLFLYSAVVRADEAEVQ